MERQGLGDVDVGLYATAAVGVHSGPHLGAVPVLQRSGVRFPAVALT